MYYLFPLLILLSLTQMDINLQRVGDREPCAAGTFYPSSPDALRNEVYNMFRLAGGGPVFNNIRAIIVPHAGYVYSGRVAATAFASIPPGAEFKNIFLIGSSHRVSFNGASVYNGGNYKTPLGTVKVNLQIADRLIADSPLFTFRQEAHAQEHCLEVQLPFIQCYFKTPPYIVPIIIGTNNTRNIRDIAGVLKPWFTPDNLFIISSDFSHYPGYDDAVRVDRETAGAIVSGSPEKLIAVISGNDKKIDGLATRMCGWSAGLVMMYLTSAEKGIEYKQLLYMNSGDSPYGDKDKVVGYNSFAIIDTNIKGEREDNPMNDMFSSSDQELLFSIARSSIETGLAGQKTTAGSTAPLSDNLRIHAGAFVTLYYKNELRGCIGRLVSSQPLCDCVKEMAYAAAFEDPRFSPLTTREYQDVTIEISVLTPLRKINSIDEIEIGRHGLYIKKDARTGVLLPQVATERGWSVIEFLEHTSAGKAGLGRDGWKEADIFVFEALVFHERK